MLFIYQHPFLLTIGISLELPVMRPPTSRPCACDLSWANWIILREWLTLREEDSLSSLGIKIQNSHQAWTISPAAQGPLGAKHRGKRKEKRSYGFNSGSSHTWSWQPLHFLVQRAKQFPFCCNMLEFTNKWIITNMPNWSLSTKESFPQTTLYPLHQTEKSFRCNRNFADCYQGQSFLRGWF